MVIVPTSARGPTAIALRAQLALYPCSPLLSVLACSEGLQHAREAADADDGQVPNFGDCLARGRVDQLSAGSVRLERWHQGLSTGCANQVPKPLLATSVSARSQTLLTASKRHGVSRVTASYSASTHGKCLLWQRGMDYNSSILAERGRFELPKLLRACRFSRPVHSTALPPLRSDRRGVYQATETASAPPAADTSMTQPPFPASPVGHCPLQTVDSSRAIFLALVAPQGMGFSSNRPDCFRVRWLMTPTGAARAAVGVIDGGESRSPPGYRRRTWLAYGSTRPSTTSSTVAKVCTRPC
jgi:hypothetical protein